MNNADAPQTTFFPFDVRRCSHCGRGISELEWQAFRFSHTYKCCTQMNLVREPSKP